MRSKNTKTTTKRFSIGRTLIVTVTAFSLVLWPIAAANAVDYDQQIQQLESEAQSYVDEANKKQAEADTLANAVAALEAQANAIQTEISANEVKLQELKEKIAETETRIENQHEVLGQNLRSMYLESDITPLEMVASSKTIGDFIDKQEYRNKLRDNIQETLSQIKNLKQQLEDSKKETENVLRDQKSRHNDVAAKEAEKNKLLAETKGEEQNYRKLSDQRKAEADQLREEQRRALSQFIGGGQYAGTGSYPWADAGGGGWYWLDCYGPDPWGMCLRQCVSYTAWKVASTGRGVPYGLGNANMWPGSARAAGIAVDGSPRAGDVAVSYAGSYGHTMYVEEVHGDGTITISQYNAGYDGRYSTNRIPAAGLTFIHF